MYFEVGAEYFPYLGHFLAERSTWRGGEKWTRDLPNMLTWRNLEAGCEIPGLID